MRFQYKNARQQLLDCIDAHIKETQTGPDVIELDRATLLQLFRDFNADGIGMPPDETSYKIYGIPVVVI